MKKFLLLLHENIEALENLSPKEMEELVNAHFNWATKLGENGHFISGDGLQDSTVRYPQIRNGKKSDTSAKSFNKSRLDISIV